MVSSAFALIQNSRGRLFDLLVCQMSFATLPEKLIIMSIYYYYIPDSVIDILAEVKNTIIWGLADTEVLPS